VLQTLAYRDLAHPTLIKLLENPTFAVRLSCI
jgi:hypothetical protein